MLWLSITAHHTVVRARWNNAKRQENHHVCCWLKVDGSVCACMADCLACLPAAGETGCLATQTGAAMLNVKCHCHVSGCERLLLREFFSLRRCALTNRLRADCFTLFPNNFKSLYLQFINWMTKRTAKRICKTVRDYRQNLMLRIGQTSGNKLLYGVEPYRHRVWETPIVRMRFWGKDVAGPFHIRKSSAIPLWPFNL